MTSICPVNLFPEDRYPSQGVDQVKAIIGFILSIRFTEADAVAEFPIWSNISKEKFPFHVKVYSVDHLLLLIVYVGS
jgi:hypothetical protein